MKKIIYKSLLFEKTKLSMLGHPLHKNENYKPFFIVGSGRSGNTLLRRILNNHSDLYIPPETYVLGKSIKQFLAYPFLKWNHLVHLIYSNFQFHPEFETFEMNELSSLVNEVSTCSKDKKSLAFVISKFYEQYAKEHNIESKRWGDKTPLNTFCMSELEKLFSKGKFIHIVRNPHDSVASYVKSGIYTNVEDAARRWVVSLETAMEFGEKYSQKYMEVKYEELVEYPKDITLKICKFLDIEFEEAMLQTSESIDKLGDVTMRAHHKNVTKPINKDSIGKGKKLLSIEQINTINKIISGSKMQRIRNMCER